MVRRSVMGFDDGDHGGRSLRRDLRGRKNQYAERSYRFDPLRMGFWITSSSSASAICAAFYRAILVRIMTTKASFAGKGLPAARRPLQFPGRPISLPSRKLAGLHHDSELARLGCLSRGASSKFRHVILRILSKDTVASLQTALRGKQQTVARTTDRMKYTMGTIF